MFHDYLTVMLINLVAALSMVAFFFLVGINSANPRPWSTGLAMTGLISLVTGLHMALTWPLPEKMSFANIAFGEPSVLLGILLLGAALSVAMEWNLWPVAIYAFFAGLMAVVIGVRLENLHLTKQPELSAAGFILAGVGGMLTPLFLLMRRKLFVRIFTATVLLLAAAIWAMTGYVSVWEHLKLFSK